MVTDNDGDTIGQVVAYESGLTMIAVEDGSNVVILQAEKEKLAVRGIRVFYENTGCEGQVYLPTTQSGDAFSASNLIYGLQGVVYGVGEPNTSPNKLGVLYKSNGPRTTVTTDSEYIAQNPGSGAALCANNQRMNQPVLPATEVIDFDATFTTPLNVE